MLPATDAISVGLHVSQEIASAGFARLAMTESGYGRRSPPQQATTTDV